MKSKPNAPLLLISLTVLALLSSVFVIRTTFLRSAVNLKEHEECCYPLDFSGELDKGDLTAYFENNKLSVPDYIFSDNSRTVLGAAKEERWIEVDLSDQKLYAWEGGDLFLETPISSGLPHTPTPTGEFRIWIKLRATKMSGGQGRYYYYLPNVPYVMFFYNESIPKHKGYGLHGTYWHNDFGNPRSHGCVNLPTPIAKELYFWTNPEIPDKKSVVYASETNPGTRIVIHE